MKTQNTISKAAPTEIALDYTRLRAEGLKYIEQFGSAFWTDYNIHDPGITILELLCYAITDLGYRTAMPVEDILSSEADNEAQFRKQFFTAKEILPTAPVSELDLRKLLIDIEGVKNAWLSRHVEKLFFDKQTGTLRGSIPEHNHFSEISLNGLYNIKIEIDELITGMDCNATSQDSLVAEAKIKEITERVLQRFHTHRNLGEDVAHVTVIETEKIRFCMDIELEPAANATMVHTAVLYRISNYLSPEIKQYSLKEMTESLRPDGSPYSMEDIFSGPVLENGFMKDEEVIGASLRDHIYASDIISLIMDIPGVIAVKNFLMNYCDSELQGRHEWCLKVDDGKKPELCACKSSINFYKDVIPVFPQKQAAVNGWLKQLEAEKSAKKKIKYDDHPFTVGTWRNIEKFTSISHNLPAAYGVGDDGIPESAGEVEQVKALQLKAFLLFFDQLLVNYLSQLVNLRNLLQMKDSGLADDNFPTYFSQRVSGIKDAAKLIDGFHDPSGSLEKTLKELSKKFDDSPERKNRILDHLLSRFAENFSDYVLQLYSFEGEISQQNIVESKILLLNEYAQISSERSLGFDYFNKKDDEGKSIATWDTSNVSGMEHRLSRLLGISDYKRRDLSVNTDDGSDEGMFLVEHILLRPDLQYLIEKNELDRAENFIPVCAQPGCDDCAEDPYSFQMTIILSAESKRFRNFDFRNYIEKTIRLETPAHIYPRVCWWSRKDLKLFEPVYKKWLEAKQDRKLNSDQGLQLTKDLISIINDKKSIYPTGRISDCENPVKNPVILDRTNLGNLKT